VFKRKANDLSSALQAELPNLKINISPLKSPKGSFECFLIMDQTKDDKIVLWSGIKRGPPRKLKFPESADIEAILANLKKHLDG
jgi:selenoprotein H